MNNDFAAYQAQVSAQYEEKMAEKEEYCAENADAEKCNDDHDNQEDKGADLQEKFDTARAYYEENGELPQNKRANYTKRGSGKHFKAAHAGIVSKMIKTVDAGRLEKALAKIDARIGSIDDEVVLDLLEGIRDSIIEVLDAQA